MIMDIPPLELCYRQFDYCVHKGTKRNSVKETFLSFTSVIFPTSMSLAR